MAGINRVRMPQHPEQEKKLNFFTDYLHYYLHFAGTLPGIELENPLSIAEKLLYQLRFNTGKDRCIPYIEVHCNRLLAYPEVYTNHFLLYASVRALIKSWKAIGHTLKQKYKALCDNLPQWTLLVSDLHVQLQQSMLNQAVDEVTQQILCEHTVSEHADSIIFYTQIIASELIFRRGTKDEAKGLISEIMPRNYKDFPYPAHVTSDEEKKIFFANKNVHDTLQAIKVFANTEAKDWKITFILEAISLGDTDKIVDFGNIRLLSLQSEEAKHIRDRLGLYPDPEVKAFIDRTDIVQCEVTVSAVKPETAYQRSLPFARRAVAYLIKRLNRNVYLNETDYFSTTDRINYGFMFPAIFRIPQLSHTEIEKIEDNAYQFFSRKRYNCQEEFLQYEGLYIDARRNEDADQLWRYLEVILHDRIKTFVSGAVLLLEKKIRRSLIGPYLRNTLHVFNSNANDLGITIEEQMEFIRTRKGLQALSKRIKSEWFRKAYKQMVAPLTSKRYREIRNFYYTAMEEAYELRNFDVHMGMGHYRATIKQHYTFNHLVNRFRQVVFIYIRSNPTYSLSQILAAIEADVIAQFGNYQKP